jgi:hypothetical protein
MASLFNVSTKRSAPFDADTGSTDPQDQVSQPAFITSQSLATFAGGSVAITVLWKVANAVFGWEGHLFPGIVAGVLGIYFFWQAVEEGSLKGSAILGAAIVAGVNACVLWAAAAGLDLGLENADVIDSATTD